MKVGVSANVIQMHKVRKADFVSPEVVRHWAEKHEIWAITAGMNPACSRIIGAADVVNFPIVRGTKAGAGLDQAHEIRH